MAAEFLAYRADANNSRADKGKYSKISAGQGGKFSGEGKCRGEGERRD